MAAPLRPLAHQPQQPTGIDLRLAPANSTAIPGQWQVLMMPHQRRTIYGVYYEQGTLTDVARGQTRALRGDSNVTLYQGSVDALIGAQFGPPILGFMVFGVESFLGSTQSFCDISHGGFPNSCLFKLTSTGTVEFYWRNTLVGTSALPLIAGRLYGIAVTGKANEQHWFIDGVEQTAGTIASDSSWQRDMSFNWGSIYLAGPAVAIAGFGFEFNPAKAKALSANPWQVFDQRRRLLFGAAAGGAGTTLIVAATETADTNATTVKVQYSAAIAATETADTNATNVAVQFSAAIAATETADTNATTVSLGSQVAIAATETADTNATSVAVQFSAAIAATETADTNAASVSIGTTLSVAATETADTNASSVAIQFSGSIAATETADSNATTVSLGAQAAIAATETADTNASSVAIQLDTTIAATEGADTNATSVTFAGSTTITVGATEGADTSDMTVVVPNNNQQYGHGKRTKEITREDVEKRWELAELRKEQRKADAEAKLKKTVNPAVKPVAAAIAPAPTPVTTADADQQRRDDDAILNTIIMMAA